MPSSPLPPFPPSMAAQLRHRDLIIQPGWVWTKTRCERCGVVRLIPTPVLDPEHDEDVRAFNELYRQTGLKATDPRRCRRCLKREEN